jgi:hypothetical protein
VTPVPKLASHLSNGSNSNAKEQYRIVAQQSPKWDIEAEPDFPTEEETAGIMKRVVARRRQGDQVGEENEIIKSGVFVDHLHEVLRDIPKVSYNKGSAYASQRRGLQGTDDFKIKFDGLDGITIEWKEPSTLPKRASWANISAQVLGPLAHLLDSTPSLKEAISIVGNGIDWQVVAETADGVKWAGHYDSYSSKLVRVLVFVIRRVQGQLELAQETEEQLEGEDEEGGGVESERKSAPDSDQDKENRDFRAQKRAQREPPKNNTAGPKSTEFAFHLPLAELRALFGPEEPHWVKYRRFVAQ